jgi:hypothetical protein
MIWFSDSDSAELLLLHIIIPDLTLELLIDMLLSFLFDDELLSLTFDETMFMFLFVVVPTFCINFILRIFCEQTGGGFLKSLLFISGFFNYSLDL